MKVDQEDQKCKLINSDFKISLGSMKPSLKTGRGGLRDGSVVKVLPEDRGSIPSTHIAVQLLSVTAF